MTDQQFEFLDVEPDETPANTVAALVEGDPPRHGVEPVQLILPDGFDLRALLTFLPDVRLKRELEALAAEATALAVTGRDGLLAADALRPKVKAKIDEIVGCFAEPCSLANQLHKRLTGLRADFLAAGDASLVSLDKRMYAETKRLDDLAAASAREAQAKADAEARERAAAAARTAEQQQAPAPIVEALKAQARTATAPPVASPTPAPTLANTTTVPNWKARFRGADPQRDPNPATAVLNAHEEEQLRALLDGIREARVPIAAVAVDWSYLNARAGKEKTTFDVPGIEAYDAGSTRSKPKGRSR